MHIISPDSARDRLTAAIHTVLGLPRDEFVFFMRQAMAEPDARLSAFYVSDPSELPNVEPHIGVEEYVPYEKRSCKYGGAYVDLTQFLLRLKAAARTYGPQDYAQLLEETLTPQQMFVNYYAHTAQVTPDYATALWQLLHNPTELDRLVQAGDNVSLLTHVGKLCDTRMEDSKVLASFYGDQLTRTLRRNYQAWQQQGINFDQYINPLYTFQQLALHHQRFTDEQDFQINPRLLEQLNLASCSATTPEGKAVWLYMRLCDVLKYDEGYFYRNQFHHPNDDPIESFKLVEDVTGDTVTTCFNFSRIAVKLLQEFAGVNATIIAAGINYGHFNFGYYTDKVSVNAEPVSASSGLNDMTRVKLGIPPTGLRVIYGEALMQELNEQIVTPMVAANKQDLRTYLELLKSIPPTEVTTQIDLEELLTILKDNQVDGAAAVQFLLSINHNLRQKPYCFARAGTLKDQELTPQLWLREKNNDIKRLDIETMTLTSVSAAEWQQILATESLVYANEEHTLGGPNQ